MYCFIIDCLVQKSKSKDLNSCISVSANEIAGRGSSCSLIASLSTAPSDGSGDAVRSGTIASFQEAGSHEVCGRRVASLQRGRGVIAEVGRTAGQRTLRGQVCVCPPAPTSMSAVLYEYERKLAVDR